ncbi:hypothetical protein [Seonamhaeicola sp.]|uniref:hypothetical protein n=1 Tax=Seonamhaeicola sp. TaxID=1912245 RepID=UPI0026042CDF|nr:hypothetical protein [Seonamhaeicola sp.]
MKRTLILFGILSAFVIAAEAQNKNLPKEKVTIENLSLSVSVNSVEDLNTLDIESLEDIFEMVGSNTPISIALKCTGKPMANGELSSFSMKVSGNSDEKEDFDKWLKKLKRTALVFYKIQ